MTTPTDLVYHAGLKYQTKERFEHVLSNGWPSSESDFYVIYSKNARTALEVLPGYAWDGPSGPTLDTPDTMRASLVHDVLYQDLAEHHSNKDSAVYKRMRKLADKEFYDLLRLDGVPWWRTQLWYWGVRIGGRKANTKWETRRFPERTGP